MGQRPDAGLDEVGDLVDVVHGLGGWWCVGVGLSHGHILAILAGHM